jgi:hypothetical protein
MENDRYGDVLPGEQIIFKGQFNGLLDYGELGFLERIVMNQDLRYGRSSL